MPPGRNAQRLHAGWINAAIGVVIALSTWSCAPVALTRPVTKIGLIAPIEGPMRAQGYDAVFAARLALREANRGEGMEGWALELVALDDGGDPARAQRQVRALGADPDVVAAIHVAAPGVRPLLAESYRSELLDVEFVAPTDSGEKPTAELSREFERVSGGIAPGLLALPVRSAVQRAIATLSAQIRADKYPHRSRP